ncbi:hypothetical protein MC885_007006 [Smutsia gigantea]|nr:hypothetical protein MC885_007006 [Smutsia gigantea]
MDTTKGSRVADGLTIQQHSRNRERRSQVSELPRDAAFGMSEAEPGRCVQAKPELALGTSSVTRTIEEEGEVKEGDKGKELQRKRLTRRTGKEVLVTVESAFVLPKNGTFQENSATVTTGTVTSTMVSSAQVQYWPARPVLGRRKENDNMEAQLD